MPPPTTHTHTQNTHTVFPAGSENGLALPYRSQPAPELPDEEDLEELPPGPCRALALRKCMTRSAVAPSPQPHVSLGLPAYVQVTTICLIYF